VRDALGRVLRRVAGINTLARAQQLSRELKQLPAAHKIEVKGMDLHRNYHDYTIEGNHHD
jgi:hypothetical protein